MEETLSARNVTTEFVDVTDEAVYIGYCSHQTETRHLFTELQVVVRTVLEHEPGTAVVGAVFHTEHPIIGTWQVEERLAERRRDGALSETALAAQVLQTLETVQF